MKAVLIGNQNCGKTTLFNVLTKSNLHVGNYPGITVAKQAAKIKNTDILLIDLPGTYSLNFITEDERIAVDNALKDADIIINVLDATSIARGLFLTKQLLEYSCPIIVVLNMMDEVEKQGGKIDVAALSRALGVEVIAISAKKEKNIARLVDALPLAKKRSGTRIDKTKEEKAAAFYKDIDLLCKKCVFLPKNEKQGTIDKILMGRFTAIPCFILIMALILCATFFVFGPIVAGAVGGAFDVLKEKTAAFLQNKGASHFLIALITDGIFEGIGSVLAFLPCVVFLSFFLSLLEDTGYMARIAFVLDRPMRVFGFSGKSIVPIIMGLGCSVPAILACRTLKSTKKQTAISIPFVSCPARLPVYFMLASAFFKQPFLIIALLYLLGFACAFAQGLFLKKKSENFLLELPPYRMPKISNVFKDMLDSAYDFFSRAFSVIFICSVLVFLLSNLDFKLNYSPDNSILAALSKMLLPLFKPIGIYHWQVLAALLAGLGAKEAILSAMSVLGVTSSAFTSASALSFLVFCSLYCPCIATLAVIKKEYGIKAAILSAIKQTAIAYVLALACFVISKSAFNF